jgi:predicted nucleic acid-binding protein
MLDTNAFNRALDTGAEPEALSSKGELFITHVQQNEIQATRNDARLDALLRVFTAIEQVKVPTSAAVWGVSEYGGAQYGDANGLYHKVIDGLNQLNGGKRGNTRDALIAVTALTENYTLVTDDSDLARVFQSNGGKVETFEVFSSK